MFDFVEPRVRRLVAEQLGVNIEELTPDVSLTDDLAASAEIQRAGLLTPYTAETIAEDALRAGRGARLELAVPPDVSDAGLAALQDEFAWLGARGVQVSIRRDEHLGPIGQRASRPDAA
jgi:hypothetical protein